MDAFHQLLRVALEAVRDAVILTDGEARVRAMNPAAEALTGWTLAEADGRVLGEIVEFRDTASDKLLDDQVGAAMSQGRVVRLAGQVVLVGAGGRRIAVLATASPLKAEMGGGCVLVVSDLSDAQQLAERITHQSHHDPLTGLPNRILLVDRLEQATKFADRKSEELAVMFVGIDFLVWLESPKRASGEIGEQVGQFAQLKSMLGAAAADGLVREAADRLTVTLRESDTVCRLGGTEFVAVVPGVRSIEDLTALTSKLVLQLGHSYSANGENLAAVCSIGVSLYPRDAADGTTLMRLADGAMYRARKNGRGRCEFVTSDGARQAV